MVYTFQTRQGADPPWYWTLFTFFEGEKGQRKILTPLHTHFDESAYQKTHLKS